MKGKKLTKRTANSSSRKPKINIMHRNSKHSSIAKNQRGTSNFLKRTTRMSTSRPKDSRNIFNYQNSGTNSILFRQGNKKEYWNNISGPSTTAQILLTSSKRDQKLRIARPPTSTNSISDPHWKQISTNKAIKSTIKQSVLRKENFETSSKAQNTASYLDKFDDPTKATNLVFSNNYKTFSFLSNLGGKDLYTPSLEKTIFDSKLVKNRNLGVKEERGMTIVTDADVDDHFERKTLKSGRSSTMRPSSSRPNLRKPPLILPSKPSKAPLFKQEKRRPMSANPKFVTISGRCRPLSAQMRMGEPKFGVKEESNHSLEEESDLNIPEISEVPRFEETEQAHIRTQELKISQRIMQAKPSTGSIFKQDKDFNLPYPDLFDRTQRTFAT